MSVFTIADLHLSTNSQTDKSMEVFGKRWLGYTDKIIRNWRDVVTESDTVIIPGDFSWGMTMSEALPDFLLIDSLPGRKIIAKGNHDFWWTTVSSMTRFLSQNSITTVSFLNNNAFEAENYIICGTRGWYLDETTKAPVNAPDFEKIIRRECMRLTASLEAGQALAAQRAENGHGSEVVVFLHFPPVFQDFTCQPLIDILIRYNVRRCYFGHIHGCYRLPGSFDCNGIRMTLCSSDFLDFRLLPLGPANGGLV